MDDTWVMYKLPWKLFIRKGFDEEFKFSASYSTEEKAEEGAWKARIFGWQYHIEKRES